MPMLPRFAPTWRNDAARKSIVFTVTAGNTPCSRNPHAGEFQIDPRTPAKCGPAIFPRRHHETQAPKIFWCAAARIRIQERRRRQQHGNRVLVHQRADNARIQRIGMKDYADAGSGRQAKRARKTKGVKKWENAHDAIVGVQHEDLIELLHVRSNVVMSEQHAFGVASRTAEKMIVAMSSSVARPSPPANLEMAFAGKGLPPMRQQHAHQTRSLSDILDENNFARRLDFDFL